MYPIQYLMMKNFNKNIIALILLTGFILMNYALYSSSENTKKKKMQPEKKKTGMTELIQVPPPPFSEDIFPCSECHADMEVNTERRVLEDAHDDIILRHSEQSRWCLDCHDAKNRDKLHLADGRLIDFKESYKLCGQCHGPKLRDWKKGIHGKRTGFWNGQKKYLLCAHCHNPHAPKFKKLKPMPAPHKLRSK